MSKFDRREFLALSAGVSAMLAAVGSGNVSAASSPGMYVCMHGATSSGFDFRAAMEGWSRAGITAAEPDLPIARTFEDANGPGSARRLMDDLGIRALSSTNQLYLEESGPQRARHLKTLNGNSNWRSPWVLIVWSFPPWPAEPIPWPTMNKSMKICMRRPKLPGHIILP